MVLNVNDPAPDFSGLDQNGLTHSLIDYRGRWLLLYFYPKDNTPGCTKEACQFRDHLPALGKFLQVLGVSVDSVKSHQQFTQKYHLSFPLLADESKTIVKAYRVWAPKKFMGREFLGTHRVSFLITPQSKIAKIYPKVNPIDHAAIVLKDIRRITAL